MRFSMRAAVVAIVGCFSVAATSVAGAAPIDSINAGAAQQYAAWNVRDVGWFYTPTFSYTLSAIGTTFASDPPRTVTVEIFSGAPGSVFPAAPSSLTLLGSGTLTTANNLNIFVDAQIGNVALTAGTRYFIGFENVQGLTTNVTVAAGATSLPGGARFDFSGNNLFNFTDQNVGDNQPILEFQGTAAAVPEPNTLALLLGAGLAGFVWSRRRRQAR